MHDKRERSDEVADGVRRPTAKRRRFGPEESGLTGIEYALIASVVSIVIAATVFLLGGQVLALFQQIIAAFGN